MRGIEWSLRALASMRAVRLFLRARAVIKYVLRAASTKKYGCRVVSKLSRRNLDFSLLKRNGVMRQAVWLTQLNQSQSLPTATCALLAMMSNYVR